MSAIPDSSRRRVLDDLAAIERDEGVRILFAVESGSRAWGFSSPDSDYDVRFVYARPLDWYLSLSEGRDVIELPIKDDFDVNGWDIRKALTLLLKPNPVLLEWLQSPLRYLWSDAVCGRLLELAQKTTFGAACVHHYSGVAHRIAYQYLSDRESVNLKRYFYVVRPALCLMWVREGRKGPPPMSLPELMSDLPLDAEFRDAMADLLVRKALSSEVGEGPRIAILDRVIEAELAWAKTVDAHASGANPNLRCEADGLFREIVKGAL